MADMEEILADLLAEAKQANRELARIAQAGGGSGGIGGGETSQEAARASGGLGSALSKAAGGLALGGVAKALGGAVGGAALSGLSAVGGAASAGTQAGAQQFLTSGGNFGASEGAFLRGAAGALGGGFFGEVTGINAAERVASRAEGSVTQIVEAAARAGNPLTREQIGGLQDVAFAREGRAEDARRLLGEVTNERFGGELERQTGAAGDRLSNALEALVDRMGQILDSRGSL